MSLETNESYEPSDVDDQYEFVERDLTLFPQKLYIEALDNEGVRRKIIVAIPDDKVDFITDEVVRKTASVLYKREGWKITKALIVADQEYLTDAEEEWD